MVLPQCLEKPPSKIFWETSSILSTFRCPFRVESAVERSPAVPAPATPSFPVACVRPEFSAVQRRDKCLAEMLSGGTLAPAG